MKYNYFIKNFIILQNIALKHEDLINIKVNLIFRNINANTIIFTFIDVLFSFQKFLIQKNIQFKENVHRLI